MNVVERFGHLFSVNPATSCWEWTGYVGVDGYGHCGDPQGVVTSAHRVVYLHVHGADSVDGLVVDHLCRNRLCVNPDHLEPVTVAENNRRKDEALGIGAYATHCVNGHEYTPENTYTRPQSNRGRCGVRDCRACIRERVRRYQARRAERGAA